MQQNQTQAVIAMIQIKTPDNDGYMRTCGSQSRYGVTSYRLHASDVGAGERAVQVDTFLTRRTASWRLALVRICMQTTHDHVTAAKEELMLTYSMT